MSRYEIRKSEINADTFIVKIDDDGKEWYIPNDEANSDYQAYMKSLDEAASL